MNLKSGPPVLDPNKSHQCGACANVPVVIACNPNPIIIYIGYLDVSDQQSEK